MLPAGKYYSVAVIDMSIDTKYEPLGLLICSIQRRSNRYLVSMHQILRESLKALGIQPPIARYHSTITRLNAAWIVAREPACCLSVVSRTVQGGVAATVVLRISVGNPVPLHRI